MLEIVTKANNIIKEMKLTNEDGGVKILYPSKITIKRMKYERDGNIKYYDKYFFTVNQELKKYLNITKYLYYYKDDNKIFISGVEPVGFNFYRASLNSKRQVLLPDCMDPAGCGAVVAVVDLSEGCQVAGGVVRVELI